MRGGPDEPVGFTIGPGNRWMAILDNPFGHSHLVGQDVPERLHARFHEIIAEWEAEFEANHPAVGAISRTVSYSDVSRGRAGTVMVPTLTATCIT